MTIVIAYLLSLLIIMSIIDTIISASSKVNI